MKKFITVGIPSKDRPIELSLLLHSLLDQTYQNFDVIIIDDYQDPFLYNNSTIFSLINLLNSSGRKVNIIQGQLKGPQYSGQQILENSKNELIFRVDDDVILRPNCIENLVKVFDDPDVVACGPKYLLPNILIKDQTINANNFRDISKSGEIIFENNEVRMDNVLQTNLILNYKNEFEVQHLYSGFMYKKSKLEEIRGYCLDYSKVGHHEETDISYRMFLNGGKLIVKEDAIAFHFHPLYGGIRTDKNGEYNPQSLWDHDDELFKERFFHEKNPEFSKSEVEVKINSEKKEIVHRKENVSICIYSQNIKKLKEVVNKILRDNDPPFSLVILYNEIKIREDKTNNDFKKYMKELSEKIEGISLIFKNLYKMSDEAKNILIEMSPETTDYFLFLDSSFAKISNEENKNWIDNLINKFKDNPNSGAISYTSFIPQIKKRTGNVGFLFTSRRVFETIGNFDLLFNNLSKGTSRCEIVEWTYRLQHLGYDLIQMYNIKIPFQYKTLRNLTENTDEFRYAIILLKSKYNISESKILNEESQIIGKKLNLGCSFNKLEGFINIDADITCNPDLVCLIEDLEYEENSIKMILIENVLEHFDLKQVKTLLKNFYNWLSSDGHLVIEVPDVEKIMEDVMLEKIKFEDMKYAITGDQESELGSHKFQFSKSELLKLLVEAGFYIKNIKDESEVLDDEYSIRFDCLKTKRG